MENALYRHMWGAHAMEALSLRFGTSFRTVMMHDVAGLGLSSFRAATRRSHFSTITQLHPMPDSHWCFVNSSALFGSVVGFWRRMFNRMGGTHVLSFSDPSHLKASSFGAALMRDNCLPDSIGGDAPSNALHRVRVSKLCAASRPAPAPPSQAHSDTSDHRDRTEI